MGEIGDVLTTPLAVSTVYDIVIVLELSAFPVVTTAPPETQYAE